MHFDKVGFIGLGLIGGSIARKMKENNPKVSIIATAGHQQTIDDAFGLGLIDNNELLELNSFKDCDVIFLCAPVNKNIEYLTQLKDIIKDDCIITDVGSTKTQIHEKVIELGLERNYLAACPAHAARRSNVCRPVAQAHLHRLNHLRLVGRRDGSRAARIVADVERSVLLQKLVAHISRILRLKG